MTDKSTEKERMFNEWFTKSYNRLRTSLRKYGMPDEDNFHDIYLFVRKQVMAPGKDITDYEAYFIGCYRKAALVKIRKENRYTHPEDDFFLRCGEEAKFISEDDLNGCERLVKDILRFIRQKFPYEEYRMFMLRFYEAQFSFKALAECMGISAAAISQKVCRIMDAVRTHDGFAWRSQMLAVESFMY
ncbi:sigma-70 family RNA polymerase sigma factor [Phocaeicola vulgatus]|uniref:sigma-70 family RNA polymerase sigma factor n=1 Tax=Phocaeicola vulgatus TaxID=821 RepID=UPI0035669227